MAPMPTPLIRIRQFVHGELLSWLFWYFLPLAPGILLASLYIAAAWITDQSGPWIIMGAGVCFMLGTVGVAAVQYGRYLDSARQQMTTGKGVPPLAVSPMKLLRPGMAPYIEVTRFPGVEAASLILYRGV